MISRSHRFFVPGFFLALTATSFSQGPPRGFDAWDTNNDGKLVKSELPEPLRKNFERVDQNKDGAISREEDAAYRNRGANPSRPNPGQRPVPDGVKAILDLDYAGNENPRQKLDLYLPETPASSPLPVVCWIHGGGWKGGSKGNGSKVSRLAATGNFAGISIGYRLSDEAQWPAQIHDCKAAIRWIRAHAEEYGLDPDRIAVWGSSAGGHLVAMLGVSHEVEGLEGEVGPHTDQSSEVRAVVNFYGPSELLTMNDHESTIDHNAANSPESLLIGGAIQRNPDKARNASPITHVSADDEPSLIVHGTKDGLVPYPQSVSLERALEAKGVATTLITVEEGGHGRGFGANVQALVEEFLAQQLLGKAGTVEDQTIPAEERP